MPRAPPGTTRRRAPLLAATAASSKEARAAPMAPRSPRTAARPRRRWGASSRSRSPGRRTSRAAHEGRQLGRHHRGARQGGRMGRRPVADRFFDPALLRDDSTPRQTIDGPMPGIFVLLRRHRTATPFRCRCRSRPTATPRGAALTSATRRTAPTGRATATSWSSRPTRRSSTSSTTPPRTAAHSRARRVHLGSDQGVSRQPARRSVHLGRRRRIPDRRAAPHGRRGRGRRGEPRDSLHPPERAA